MNTQSMSNKVNTLTDDAQKVLSSTSEETGERIAEAGNRLKAALEKSKEVAGQMREKTIAGAKKTDVVVRQNPYQAIGIAIALGALLGFFLGRRGED